MVSDESEEQPDAFAHPDINIVAINDNTDPG